MKRSKLSSILFVLVLFLALFTTFSILSVEARKNYTKKSKTHKQKKEKKNNGGGHNNNSPAPAPLYGGGHQTYSKSFNILSFGAKGNGASDDSKALLGAWKAACSVPGATLQIPSGFKFLINPISLQGPCMPRLTLQIDGTLLAPPRIGSWPKSSLFQWLNFKWVQDFVIQGSGTVDGQGSNWWKYSEMDCKQNKRSKNIPNMKPTAMRFFASNNVTVRGIKIINSPLCHLKFDNSEGVKINNISILSPENSPNTDGIHLQNTKDVEIAHSSIASGDDCVSIQTGCSNIHIHHINCGPGHGISLGGLGKDKSVACVSDITIENILMENTLYGARIKTWQGGLGSVRNVSFSNIHVSNVKVPIMIDQYYCDKGFCKNQTGAVSISRVKFDQIIGTYAAKPIHLACSNSIPCTNIDLFNIQLKPSSGFSGFQQGLCWNSYGKSEAPLAPSSMDYCVRRESDFVRRISRSHEFSCQ